MIFLKTQENEIDKLNKKREREITKLPQKFYTVKMINNFHA